MEAQTFGGLRPCLLRPSYHHHRRLQKGFFSQLSPPRRCMSSVNTKVFFVKDEPRAEVKPASKILKYGAQNTKRKEVSSTPLLQSLPATMKYASLLLCRVLLVAGIGLSLSKPALAQSSSPVIVEETIDNKIAETLDKESANEEATETNGGVESLHTIEDKIAEAEAQETSEAKVEVTTGANGAETGMEETMEENVANVGTIETIDRKIDEKGVEETIDGKFAERGFEKTTEEKSAETVAQSDRGPQKEDGLGISFWEDSELVQGSMESILKDILDGDPTNISALECLAKRLVENDDFDRSLIVFEKLEALEPNEIQWKFMKAQAFNMIEKYQSSKATFLNILKLEPFSAKALQGLLIVMDQLGEMEQAFAIVERTIGKAKKEKKPQEAREIGMVVGQFLMLKGKLHEALDQYDEILEEDENDFRPYLCQGIIYSILGDKQMADQRFQSYNDLCPKDLPDRKYLDGIMGRAKREAAKIDEFKRRKSCKSVKVNEAKERQSQEQPSKNEQES